jgi:hypothetical protein
MIAGNSTWNENVETVLSITPDVFSTVLISINFGIVIGNRANNN